MKKIKNLLVSAMLLWSVASSAVAALDIELTKGVEGAIPVAVVPFSWGSRHEIVPVDIAKIVSSDLAMSGRFTTLPQSAISQHPHKVYEVNYGHWQQKNIDNLVIGQLMPLGNDRYRIEFTLLSVFKGKGSNQDNPSGNVIISQEFTVSGHDLRRYAHHISDLVYQQLTGERGFFTTRLAYVLVDRPFTRATTYRLEVADVDGHNAVPILRSSEPIMSPSWSPDGKRIAYVSFEGKRPRVYVSHVATGQRQLVSSYPGINGAPAWSPDGSRIALALSKGLGSNPNIYVMDLTSKHLEQMTRDGAINTEPSWAPDGKSLIFTSDRGGTPQIYQLNLSSRRVQRLTYDGNYNASGLYTPDGKSIVLLHRGNFSFNIALFDVQSGGIRELTKVGKDESPSVAPNGKMVVFARSSLGQSTLGMVSTDGRVKLTLPYQGGNVQEPTWSPFLS